MRTVAVWRFAALAGDASTEARPASPAAIGKVVLIFGSRPQRTEFYIGTEAVRSDFFLDTESVAFWTIGYWDGISTATEATHFHVPFKFTQVSRKRSRRVTVLPFSLLCVRNIPSTNAEFP